MVWATAARRTAASAAVTWCFGHMLELAWPQEYKPEYAQWRREHLPIIPSEWKYKVKKDSAKQLAVIGSLLREADSVVNAGDPDREGQLLVDEVLEHFKYRGPVARIWLPSLDDKSVRIALNGIRDNAPYAPLRDAARARSLADWLVGINATRAMTIKGREGGRSETLSLGRVQTPTLALVVARDREITNFRSTDYFVLRATLTHAAGGFTATFVPAETQAVAWWISPRLPPFLNGSTAWRALLRNPCGRTKARPRPCRTVFPPCKKPLPPNSACRLRKCWIPRKPCMSAN